MPWGGILLTANAVLCFIALLLLGYSARLQWGQWNFKTQIHWWALFAWVCVGCEAQIEAFITHIPLGPRTVLTTLAVAWTIRALFIDDELNVKSSFHGRTKNDTE